MGRDTELSVIDAAVTDLVEGRGGVLLIEGDAGLGKSRLVADGALPAAQSAGITTLTGHGDEVTASRPFGLIVDLLAGTGSTEVEHLLEPPALPVGISGPALRFRIADAVRARVAELSADGPVLAVAEDIHDADEGSLLALHELVRASGHLPVLLILTRRRHPATDDVLRLVEVVEDAGSPCLRLAPLAPHQVRQLVEGELGATPGSRLLALVDRAAGNPLFVTQLIAGLTDEGALTHSDAVVELDRTVLPPSLASTILRRVRGLTPRCRSLLRHAAVLGTTFRIDDLAVVLSANPTILTDELTEAFDAGLLTDDLTKARFAHALVRDAVYQDISSAVRATLHREAGRRLAAAQASASQVAHHLAIGAVHGDLDALDWLERAAREAAPQAPGLAVEQLQRALSLVPAGRPELERRLLVALARCLLWSGHLDDAGETARQILASSAPSPAEAGEARFVLGRMLVYHGEIGASIEQVELALHEDGASDDLRGQLLGDLALRRGLFGDLDGADDAARRALVVGQERGDSLTVCTARCALAWTAALRGDTEAAVSYAGRAVRAPRPTDAVEPVQSRLYLGFARMHAADLTGARAILQDASSHINDLGAAWGAGLAPSLLAMVGWLDGHWDDAAAAAASAFAAADSGAARTWLPLAAAASALVAASRDDLDTAARLVAAGDTETVRSGGPHVAAGLLGLARARLIEADGAPDRAHQLRIAAIETDVAFGARAHLPLHVLELAHDRITATDARRLADDLDQVTADSANPLAQAAARRCRGIADRDPHELLAAAQTLEATTYVFHRARILEDAAVALARAGSMPAATEAGTQALSVYQDLGAVRDADHCRARLREAGVHTGTRGPRERAVTGWSSLTPAERRVVRLVAGGLNNPEIAQRLFISRRTVESHVSSALGKMAVSSRVELAVLAAEQATDESGSR